MYKDIQKLLKNGIKLHNPEPIQVPYATTPKRKRDNYNFIERKSVMNEYINEVIPNGNINDIKTDDIVFRPLPETETRTGMRLQETMDALYNIQQSPNSEVIFYDIENIGSSLYSKQGTGQKAENLEIAQMSIYKNVLKDGKLVPDGDAFVLTKEFTKETRDVLQQHLNQLEQNPMHWQSLNDDTRRTLIDLTLYENVNNFKTQKINGMTVKTLSGQRENRPSVHTMAATQASEISLMKRGLENMTNTELVNTNEEFGSFLNNYASKNAVWAGHNNTTFDKNLVTELLGKQGVALPQSFLNPQLDTQRLSEFALGGNASSKNKSYQLSDVYSALMGEQALSNQAHFAGDDAFMSSEIARKLLATPDVKTLLTNQQMQSVKKGTSQTYIATQGTGIYRPNAYHRDRNRFSMQYRKNPKTGVFEVNNDYQETAMTPGHEYLPLGMGKPKKIDGIDYHSLFIQDVESQTVSVLMDSDKDRLLGNFQDGILKRSDLVKSDERDYYRRDAGRRSYASIFDHGRWGGENSSVNEIIKAKQHIESYEKHYSTLKGSGVDDSVVHSLAVQKTYEEALGDRTSGMLPSRNKIENLINFRDTMKADQEYLDTLVSEAKRMYPDAKGDTLRQQNIFIKTAYDQYREAVDMPNPKLGHSGMKLYGINASILGETTYLNVSSPKRYEESLKRLTQKGNDQGNGSVRRNMDTLLNNLKGKIDDVAIQEIRDDINRDLQTKNYVSNRTLERISTRTYQYIESSPNVVSHINMPHSSARSNGIAITKDYHSGLSSSKSEFFESIIQNAKEETTNRLSMNTNKNAFQLSGGILEQAKKTTEVMNKFDEDLFASQHIFNMDTGAIKESKKRELVKRKSINEQINTTLEAYQKQNFDTALVYNPNTKQSYLAFSFKEDGIDLGAMSFKDFDQNNRIGMQPLPFIDGRGAIKTGVGTITHEYRFNFDKGGKPYLSSNVDEMFENIQRQAKTMRKEHKVAKAFGLKTNADIIETGVASINFKNTEGAVATSYAHGFSSELAHQIFSRDKTKAQGYMIDAEPMFLNHLKNSNPDIYQSWNQYSSRDGAPRKESIFGASGFWREYERGTYERTYMESIVEFNKAYGKDYGVQLSIGGLNASQFNEGKAYIRDLRSDVGFGRYNSQSREQINKVGNYLALEREPLREYLRQQGLSEDQINRRLNADISFNVDALTREAYENTEQVKGIHVRTMYTDDKEIHQRVSKARKTLDEQIKQLEQEGLSLTENKKAYKRNRAQIQSLIAQRNELNGLSVFDGQSLIRESLLESMTTKQTRSLMIAEGHVLPDGILKQVATQDGLAEDDFVTGMNLGLKSGFFEFDKPITYSDMQNLNLIDKHGMLTTSGLVKETIAEEAESALENVNTKRIQKNARIIGIAQEGGKLSLQLEETVIKKEMSKLLHGEGDGRFTAVPISDNIANILSDKRVDFFREFSKVDKDNLGSTISVLQNTMEANLLDELNRIRGLDGATSQDVQLPALKKFMTKNLLTVSDLNKEGMDQRVIEEVLFPQFTRLGVTDELSFDTRTGKTNVSDIGFRKQMVGEAGKKNYNELYNAAVSDFNFDSKYALNEIRSHNTASYSGTGTRARSSHRERILEQISDELIFGNGHKSVYREHMSDIRKGSGFADEHAAFARRVLNDYDSRKGAGADHAQSAGNIILDLTGQYEKAGDSNIFLDEKTNSYVVSAHAMRTGKSIKDGDYSNTLSDPMSLRLFNEELGIDNTLGELLERDESAKAYLKIQNADDNIFNTDFMPIYGRVSQTRDGNLRQSEKEFQNIVDTALEYQTLQKADITTATLSKSEITSHIDGLSEKMSRHQTGYSDSVGRYLSDSSKGSLVKNLTGGQAIIGRNDSARTFNQAFMGGTSAPGAADIFYSREAALSLIGDNEENILRMNRFSSKDIKEIVGDRTGVERSEYLKNFILDELSEQTHDKKIDFYSEVTRFPVQSTGNIQIGRIRVDESIEEGVRISPELSELLRADYDGDVIYSSADAYFRNGKTLKDMHMIQAEMRKRNEALGKNIIESLRTDGSSVSDTFNAWAKTDSSNFRYQDGLESFVKNFVVGKQKAEFIGQTDNMLTAGRQLVTAAYMAAHEEGFISDDKYKKSLGVFDDSMDVLMQSLISAKKVTSDAIGIDGIVEKGVYNADDYAHAITQSINYMNTATDVVDNLRDINLGNVENIIDLALQNKNISPDDVPNVREALSVFAISNEASISGGFGGMRSASLELARSSGSTDPRFYKGLANGDFSGIIHNPVTDTLAENLLSGEKLQGFKEHAKSTSESIAVNTAHAIKRAEGDFGISDAAENQLQALFEISNNNKRMRHMEQVETLTDSLKGAFKSTASSTPFKVGAGFAAMWMVGSALKGGPTPEGNEAQQEASPVEVAPSALLTSPTARVKPRGEQMQLNISGSGNVDQNMLAGIINEQIATQTGIPMQMNINTTDNISSLNNQFYEQTISKILGV